jgi:hypothetical protein
LKRTGAAAIGVATLNLMTLGEAQAAGSEETAEKGEYRFYCKRNGGADEVLTKTAKFEYKIDNSSISGTAPGWLNEAIEWIKSRYSGAEAKNEGELTHTLMPQSNFSTDEHGDEFWMDGVSKCKLTKEPKGLSLTGSTSKEIQLTRVTKKIKKKSWDGRAGEKDEHEIETSTSAGEQRDGSDTNGVCAKGEAKIDSVTGKGLFNWSSDNTAEAFLEFKDGVVFEASGGVKFTWSMAPINEYVETHSTIDVDLQKKVEKYKRVMKPSGEWEGWEKVGEAYWEDCDE